MSERAQYAAMQRVAHALGVRLIVTSQGSARDRLNEAGVPDLVGYVFRGAHKGRFVGVEVKSLRGKPTDAQKAWISSIQGSGGIGLVVRSVPDLMNDLQVSLGYWTHHVG